MMSSQEDTYGHTNENATYLSWTGWNFSWRLYFLFSYHKLQEFGWTVQSNTPPLICLIWKMFFALNSWWLHFDCSAQQWKRVLNENIITHCLSLHPRLKFGGKVGTCFDWLDDIDSFKMYVRKDLSIGQNVKVDRWERKQNGNSKWEKCCFGHSN